MSASGLKPDLLALQSLAADVAARNLLPICAKVDQEGIWPAEGMAAIAKSGLMGLHIPKRLGGLEQGLLALAVVTEELGAACSSTAMCFGMHSVAAKVLAAKATRDQEERFLVPIAEGRHITSLALSEPTTGSHFFLPQSQFHLQGDQYSIDGHKSFVTSGGHADSYVVSAVARGSQLDPGAFSCIVIEGGTEGLEWQGAWHGVGMRGNSSKAVLLRNATVPAKNLLGAEGDQIWYVFEIVAPYFLIAMSGVYLGIARTALNLAIEHLKSRVHSHTGETLSEVPVLWHQVAEAWTELEASRQLIRSAARAADAGAPDAALSLFAAKSRVAHTVTSVTETAMMLVGGRGYAENSQIARLHRDARAAHVMSPTTHLLQTWLGRSLLGLPLL
ncbi:MAG TPA: acyl-CoA dehydrogenase family protein [Pseudorhizobium sp.]|nr:acyl-CoA dehydrogenase family protein [Pseudorhizobium sp.]